MKFIAFTVEGEKLRGRLEPVVTNEYLQYSESLRPKQIPELFDKDFFVTIVYRRKGERISIERYKEVLKLLRDHLISNNEEGHIKIDISPLVRDGLDLETIRMGLYVAFKSTKIEVVVL